MSTAADIEYVGNLVPVIDDIAATEDAVDLTADEAEQITSRIRQWANAFPVEDVVRAFRGRIWVALAYDSWAEWCECELGGLKLPVPQRREIVAELASAGMSNRAIADAVDVDHKTVGNDLSATGENSPVDRKSLGADGRERSHPRPSTEPQIPETDSGSEVIDAEIVDPPQARPAPKPSSKPAEPRRRPLTDSAREIGLDLKNLTARMEKLLADDRFARNKGEVAPHLRHYLTEAIKVCQDLNHHLT